MNTKPRHLNPLIIKRVQGFVTNIDTVDLKENYAFEVRGFKQFRDGMVGERDYGTHHRFSAIPTGISIIDGLVMYSSIYASEYFVIFGLDANGNLRMFVHDPTSSTYKHTGDWIELTAKITATIVSVSGNTVTLDAPRDILAASITSIGTDALQQFLVVSDSPHATPALVTANTATGVSPYQFELTTLTEPLAANGWNGSGTVTLYRSTGILPDMLLDLGSSADTGRGYQYNYGSTPHIRFLNLDAQSKILALIGDSSTVPVMDQPLQIKRGGHLAHSSFTLGGSIATGWATGAGIATLPDPTNDHFALATYRAGSIDYVWLGSTTGIVYKSADAGATWDAGITIEVGQSIQAISFADEDHGFLACGTKVYKTTDGGASWIVEPYFSALTVPIYDLQMSSLTEAVASGNGIAYIWNSGTWTTATVSALPKPIHYVRRLGDYLIAGEGLGYTTPVLPFSTFMNKVFQYSSNAGVDWSDCTFVGCPLIPSGMNTYGLAIAAMNVVYGVLYAAPTSTIVKAIDGMSFTPTTGQLPTGFIARTIWAADVNTVRVVGTKNGMVASALTVDGGTNWTEEVVAAGTLAGSAYELGHFIADFSRGFLVGSAGVVAKLNAASGTVGSGAYVGWQINKATLLPNFLSIGDATTYLPNGTIRTAQDLGEGIQLGVTVGEDAAAGKQYYVRMYITALYAEATGSKVYMESDPIAQVYAAAGVDKFAKVKLTFYIDPSLVNKNLIGFNCYVAYNDNLTLPAFQWFENPDQYKLAAEVLLSSNGWVFTDTNRFCYSLEVDLFTYPLIFGSGTYGQPSIYAMLARSIDLDRTYIRPRFISKATRTQGAAIAMDQDDRTLRLTTYGAGGHEDENLPDQLTDNAGNKLKVNLIGRGELMGLSTMNDNVVALRSSEIEIYDLQSGFQRIVGADVVAKRSILPLLTPHGLIWAGDSGIYFMPADGSQIVTLNKSWMNFYNGDKKLADNITSYVTHAYRKAIITGFDDFYQEVWCQIQCNITSSTSEYLQFRYSFQTHLWTVRQLNIGTNAPVTYFASRSTDKTFVIGYAAGILKYPNQNGLLRYQDDCTVNGNAEPYTIATAHKGIPTKMLLNIGSVYGLDPNSVLWSVIPDAFTEGEVGSKWYMKFYGNGVTTSFSDKTIPVGIKPIERMLPARGQLESLRIEFGLDATNAENLRSLDISTILLNFIGKPRIGTE
jgi:hypothetical protein